MLFSKKKRKKNKSFCNLRRLQKNATLNDLKKKIKSDKLILCSKKLELQNVSTENLKMKPVRKETFRRLGDIRCLRTQNIIPCWDSRNIQIN